MDIYKKSIKKLNDFFNINLRKHDCSSEIFAVLKNIVPFNSAYIFYISQNEQRLVYYYNNKLTCSVYKIQSPINYIDTDIIEDDLKIESAIFAKLVLTRNEPYSEEEKNIITICSNIISGLIKSIELNNIIAMQVEAQQEGLEELNKAYNTIKKQNLKILKTDKVKNNFLSHVSHELRTPLNSIIGFSDLLSAGCCGCLNDKQNEYVNDIKISGLHLLGMINEILDIAKLESNAMKMNYSHFIVEQAITETVNIVKPLAMKKNININFINDSNSITADYQKFQQILFNLLSNAIKFTKEDGNIEIKSKQTSKYLYISIKDDGIGIDKKYHKKIFKKFEQIENITNQSSTGLGLTITKELVKLHNGKIKLISEIGKGSIFEIKIPC